MLKPIFAAACLAAICQLSFAESCPNVATIKKNTLTGWKIYDSEDASELTPEQQVAFRNQIHQFALAEYEGRGQSGSMHCYYRDKTGAALEAYLAKDHFSVAANNQYWYPVSGFMHCAADQSKCNFQATPVPTEPAKKLT